MTWYCRQKKIHLKRLERQQLLIELPGEVQAEAN